MHRLIHLVSQTPQFIPILQSTPFRSEEAVVKQSLESTKGDLDGKGGRSKRLTSGNISAHGLSESMSGTPKRGSEGRLIGQVNELWGRVEEVRRRRKGSGGMAAGWMADEAALREVGKVSRPRINVLYRQLIAMYRYSRLSRWLCKSFPNCLTTRSLMLV